METFETFLVTLLTSGALYSILFSIGIKRIKKFDRDKVESYLSKFRVILQKRRVLVFEITILLFYSVIKFIYGSRLLHQLRASFIISAVVSSGILLSLFLDYKESIQSKEFKKIQYSADPWLFQMAHESRSKELFDRAFLQYIVSFAPQYVVSFSQYIFEYGDSTIPLDHHTFIHDDSLSIKIRNHARGFRFKLYEELSKHPNRDKFGVNLLFEGTYLNTGFQYITFIGLVLSNIFLEFFSASFIITVINELNKNYSLHRFIKLGSIGILAILLLFYIDILLYTLFFYGIADVFTFALDFLIYYLTGLATIFCFYFFYDYFHKHFDLPTISLKLKTCVLILAIITFILFFGFYASNYFEPILKYNIYNNNILQTFWINSEYVLLFSVPTVVPLILFVCSLFLAIVIQLFSDSLRIGIVGYLDFLVDEGGSSHIAGFIGLLTLITALLTALFSK